MLHRRLDGPRLRKSMLGDDFRHVTTTGSILRTPLALGMRNPNREVVMQGWRIRAATALACGMAFLMLGCSDGASVTDSLEMNKGVPGPPNGETESNNLSVPTIMIGGGFTGVTCPGGLVYPTGTPLTGYEIDLAAYYFLQGVHKWQGECTTATSATATADWGDNLSGDAKLKAGKPIRVELGLFDDTGMQMQGFSVLKLEPSKLDRESAYGTLATEDGVGGWYATAEYLPVRVYDAGVTFSVKNIATGVYVVPLGTNPTAEINATGRVVYGYNMRVTDRGEYEITFVLPSVDITDVDVGTYTTDPLAADTVTLVITVQ